MRKARMAIAWLATTAVLAVSLGIVMSVTAAAATTLYTVRTSVNVRSGPGSSFLLLETLQEGQVVQAAGSAANGWLPIRFSNATAYVYANYVTATASSTTPATAGPPGRKTPRLAVNVRSTPSLSATIAATISKGSPVKVTGRISGGFTEVTVGGSARWIYSTFLSAATDTSPEAIATATATTTLTLRDTPSFTGTSPGEVKAKTVVGLTGEHQGSFSQIVTSAKTSWALTGYLDVTSTTTSLSLPTATALRYVTASGVTLRAAADAESPAIATLSKGTQLQVTAISKSGFSQAIYGGTTFWLSSAYLSATRPADSDLGSTSLNKLQGYGKAAVTVLRDQFPEIRTMYGWRAYSAYSSDHPNGRALDVMIPSYKANKALGDRVADYVIAHNQTLHVKSIIWRQRSYTMTRGTWVSMAGRGGDTANHMDHVHISFYSN
ncbi:MAG: SH3 domain-containing protein [Propionicimonas sp.]